VGVIFDSSVWIALAGGQLLPEAVAKASDEAPIFTSVVALGELSFGVQACADPAQRAARAAFLRQVEQRPTLDVTPQTAAAFGMLAASVKQGGRSPRPRYNDLWIAAQAIEHNYALLTLNRADFEGLPGLKLLALNPP
jgi:predicted nucleic acid-binding protein